MVLYSQSPRRTSHQSKLQVVHVPGLTLLGTVHQLDNINIWNKHVLNGTHNSERNNLSKGVLYLYEDPVSGEKAFLLSLYICAIERGSKLVDSLGSNETDGSQRPSPKQQFAIRCLFLVFFEYFIGFIAVLSPRLNMVNATPEAGEPWRSDEAETTDFPSGKTNVCVCPIPFPRENVFMGSCVMPQRRGACYLCDQICVVLLKEYLNFSR